MLNSMTVTLDDTTEQLLQQQLARGVYATPAELIAHALSLVAAEDDWLYRNREAINADLDESFAQVARGQVYTEEEAEIELGRRRAAPTS